MSLWHNNSELALHDTKPANRFFGSSMEIRGPFYEPEESSTAGPKRATDFLTYPSIGIV